MREAAEHAVEDELTGRGSTQGTGKGEAEPQLQYDSVVDFVTDFLAPTYGRALSSSRIWCPQWWSHAEALYRLDALWRSWEHLRMDAATGSSVWLRDHADHHMAVLMSDSGPFKGCSPEKGHRQRDPDNDWSTLPLAPPPPGLFD
ncbi:DUF4913 domain-containing protein [Kineococcus sp. T90]|nr:DUF4913 domain-containing protein [Kineococcus indalonis]